MAGNLSSKEPDGPGARTPVRREPGGPNSRWPEYVQFIFVVCLTVVLLLVAVSMKRHHFMRGELYEQSHPYDR